MFRHQSQGLLTLERKIIRSRHLTTGASSSKARLGSDALIKQLRQDVMRKHRHPSDVSKLLVQSIEDGHDPPELIAHTRTDLRYLISRYLKRAMPSLAVQEVDRTVARGHITEYELMHTMADEYIGGLISSLPPIHSSAEARRVQLARAVSFLEKHESMGKAGSISVKTFERLMRKLLEAGDISKVLEVLDLAERNGITIDMDVWQVYLSIKTREAPQHSDQEAFRVLGDMKRSGVEPNARNLNMLLKAIRHPAVVQPGKDILTRSRHIVEVAKLTGAYNEHIAVTEMAILKAQKRYREAIDVFAERFGPDVMQSFGFSLPRKQDTETQEKVRYFEVTKYSLSAFLDVLVLLNATPKSLRQIHLAYYRYINKETRREEFASDEFGPSILIRAFANHRSTLPKALSILEGMRKRNILPNVVTYNHIIHGMARSKMMDLALEAFEHMKADGIAPNDYIWKTLATGYGRIGDHRAAQTCRLEMSPGARDAVATGS